MGTVAGALREYFRGHGELPSKPLKAAVPVSLRAAGDDTANNQVSGVTMTLATDVAEPLARLKVIAEGSARAKAMIGRMKAAIPTDFPMLAAPWLMSGLASLYGRSRLANVLPPLANVVISNVPGVQTQLYFAGAKVVSYYPVSIAAHGMALNVTVQSYNGRLDYGLIACRRALPDIMELADALLAEHRKLLELARGLEAAAAVAARAAAPAARATRRREPTVEAAPLKLVRSRSHRAPVRVAGSRSTKPQAEAASAPKPASKASVVRNRAA
jgi:WS/DGAT/MGAT family acyltransferase